MVLLPRIFLLLLGLVSLAGSTEVAASYSWTWVEQAAQLGREAGTLPLLLKLKATSVVEGDSIYLSELAECVGDAAACDEVYGIRLLASPAPGNRARISKSTVAKILSDEWPIKNWRLEGPERLTVNAAELRMAAADVQSALEQLMAEQAAQLGAEQDGLRYRVKNLRLTGPLRLRPASYRLQFDEWQEDAKRGYEWVQQKYKTMQAMQVRFVPQEQEGLQEKISAVLLSMEVWAKVLVTRKSIGSTELLSPDDVIVDWQPINRRLDSYARGVGEIEGYRLKHSLPAGQVILRQQLQTPLAVERGARLNLQVHDSGMVVTGLVRALEAGRIGEVISVMYDDTKTRLRAKVLDGRTVEMHR